VCELDALTARVMANRAAASAAAEQQIVGVESSDAGRRWCDVCAVA